MNAYLIFLVNENLGEGWRLGSGSGHAFRLAYYFFDKIYMVEVAVIVKSIFEIYLYGRSSCDE